MKQHGHLKRLFRNYRDKYFGASIPDDVAVGWDAHIPQDSLGLTTAEMVDGRLVASISLNPLIRPFASLYKQVLLHEMVHLKLFPWMKHGKRFDAEMLRLAAEGALKGLW